MTNQPKCAKCGSEKFNLIQLIRMSIDHFDENDNPIDFDNREVDYSVVKCAKCRTLLERS